MSGPTTGLQNGQEQSGVTVGIQYFVFDFFLNDPILQVLRGMAVRQFAQIFEDLTA